MTEALFIFLQKVAPQHLISRLAGFLAESEISWWKNFFIRRFAKYYDVNLEEAEKNRAEDYKNFNTFFTRALKPGARIICQEETHIACPADGAISQIGKIDSDKIFQAKGHNFSLDALLGSDKFTETFQNGSFATIYLAPKDYHRVHCPSDATLKETLHIPGKLFSVNNTTANHIPGLFARNERLVKIFETNHGPMAVIMVGAMIVASIETSWAGLLTPGTRKVQTQTYNSKEFQFKKGEELGRFRLGSTAILLFPSGKINWNNKLMPGSSVRMGESIGSWI